MENIFECDICGKKYQYQYLLNRHFNAKRKCNNRNKIIYTYNEKINNIDKKIDELIISSFDNKNKCSFCDNSYMNKSNLKRHINLSCIKKQELITEKNKYIELRHIVIKDIKDIKDSEIKIKQNKEIEQLKTELHQQKYNIENIKENMKNIDNTKNINITVNTINNIDNLDNLNIPLNSFGRENLSHISNKDYEKYLSKLFPGLLEYIEHVHFSDNMPSNHNICIPKLNSKYIAIFEKNKWNLKDKNELLNKFITKKISALDKKCDELENKQILTENTVESYNDFINTYYEGGDESKKKFKEDIELLIFNNRAKIKNYNKLLK